MKKSLLIVLTIIAAHTLTFAGFNGSLQTTWTPTTIFKELVNGTTVTGEFIVSVSTLTGTSYNDATIFVNSPNVSNPSNQVVVSILSGFSYTNPLVVTSVIGYTIDLSVNTFTGTVTGQINLRHNGANYYEGYVNYTFVVYDYAPTVLVTQPQNATICGGNLASLSVSATGIGTLSYLWSNGSTNSTLITSIAGNYMVTVTGLGGTAVSSVAGISITPNTLIATHPISESICSGSSGTLIVSATGSNLSYAWNTGETSSMISKSVAGSYMVTVSGTCGTVISSTAGISLKANTAINALPSAITVCTGLGLNLNAIAVGENLSYQWSKNDTILPNPTNPINIVSASLSDAGAYQVSVSGTCGNAVSSQVQVSISGCNSLTTVPSSITGLGNIEDNKVSIYPNPNTGSFTIDAPTYTSAQIVNLFGEVIQTLTLSDKTPVNVVTKGLYLVRLYSNTDSKLFKIIVE